MSKKDTATELQKEQIHRMRETDTEPEPVVEAPEVVADTPDQAEAESEE